MTFCKVGPFFMFILTGLKDHPLYSDKNKKVIGKFKDELNGIKILEYIGLK
jgi:hypothetical protein